MVREGKGGARVLRAIELLERNARVFSREAALERALVLARERGAREDPPYLNWMGGARHLTPFWGSARISARERC
jgi:hypothetical protein